MINKKLRESLPEETVVFENPSFDNSIIGLDYNDRAIYDVDKMIEEFMADNDCSYDDASDFVSYNTLRSLNYYENAPIVLTMHKEDISWNI